jgi:hypothetical protein
VRALYDKWLTKEIDHMPIFSWNWNLKFNLNETKVRIFKKAGKIRENKGCLIPGGVGAKEVNAFVC